MVKSRDLCGLSSLHHPLSAFSCLPMQSTNFAATPALYTGFAIISSNSSTSSLCLLLRLSLPVTDTAYHGWQLSGGQLFHYSKTSTTRLIAVAGELFCVSSILIYSPLSVLIYSILVSLNYIAGYLRSVLL